MKTVERDGARVYLRTPACEYYLDEKADGCYGLWRWAESECSWKQLRGYMQRQCGASRSSLYRFRRELMEMERVWIGE